MSKTTSKLQIQMLLELMEAHPGIARGFHKGNKEEVSLFWKKAEAELNSSGPPRKTIAEWKKVWSDQKKYVRAKAALNLKARNGTGGGPNKEQQFSQIEQAIYNLVGMKESVEGVAVASFGLETFRPPAKVISPPVDVLSEEDEFEIETLLEQEQVTPTNTSVLPNLRPPVSTSARISTASEALEKEIVLQTKLCAAVMDVVEVVKENLVIQKELCETVKNVVEDVRENHRNTIQIYRSIDKIYEIQKEKYHEMVKIETEKLEETKRHNWVMQGLRKREVEAKIEKNRQLIELEELKNHMAG